MSCPPGPSQTTRVLADVWSSCGYDPAESASGIGGRRASSEAIRVRTTSCTWGLHLNLSSPRGLEVSGGGDGHPAEPLSQDGEPMASEFTPQAASDASGSRLHNLEVQLAESRLRAVWYSHPSFTLTPVRATSPAQGILSKYLPMTSIAVCQAPMGVFIAAHPCHNVVTPFLRSLSCGLPQHSPHRTPSRLLSRSTTQATRANAHFPSSPAASSA